MAVTSWVVPSEKLALAVKGWVNPLAILGAVGLMASDLRVAEVTTSGVSRRCPSYSAITR